MRFTFLLVFLSFGALAQHSSQPQKESAEDLRTGIVMFSIEDLGEKTSIWLERTASLDYFLRRKEDDEEKLLKISAKDAKKMDMDFASKFLKCQYELPPSGEDCKVTLRLSMKGEVHEVCREDDKKAQEINPFFQDLEKRF